MSDEAAPAPKKKGKGWIKRLTGWEGKVLTVILFIAAVLFIFMNLDKLRSSGFIGLQPESSTVEAPKKEKNFRNHNVVKIRNEVYVINDAEVSIDDMPGYLAELKKAKPGAVIELDTTGEEKIGMVTEIEKAALKHRITIQKK